jgi:hypothetical protein
LPCIPLGNSARKRLLGNRRRGWRATGSRSGSMSRAPRLSTRRSVRPWRRGLGRSPGRSSVSGGVIRGTSPTRRATDGGSYGHPGRSWIEHTPFPDSALVRVSECTGLPRSITATKPVSMWNGLSTSARGSFHCTLSAAEVQRLIAVQQSVGVRCQHGVPGAQRMRITVLTPGWRLLLVSPSKGRRHDRGHIRARRDLE